MREASFGYIGPIIVFLIGVDVARDAVQAWWHPRVVARIQRKRHRRQVLRALASMQQASERWMEAMRKFSESADKATEQMEKMGRAFNAGSE